MHTGDDDDDEEAGKKNKETKIDQTKGINKNPYNTYNDNHH